VAVQPSSPPPVRLVRYLPLAALTTFVVVISPALLVALLAPRGGLLQAALAAAAAVAISIAFNSAAAAVWKRGRTSRDIVFADLMLWGWLRRYRTERHLSRLRDLVESSSAGGSPVAVQLLIDLAIRLERRDPYTSGHSQRVARYAARTARAMGLSPAEIAAIRTAGLVHDVGKLYTRREVLNNPGRLSDAEFDEIKRHPGDGADMLAGVEDREITAIVRHHHERLDGRGYPDGLAGAAIPLGARIIAVADTFDALTSSRAYRRAATQQKAIEILSEGAGSQLDGVAVAAFLRSYSSRRSVLWGAVAVEAPWSLLSGLQAASSSVGVTAGVASLLPALGVVGALSLSHGLPGASQVNRLTSLPTQSRAPAPAALSPSLHASKTTTRRATSPRHPRRALIKPRHTNVTSPGPLPSRPSAAGGPARTPAPAGTVSPSELQPAGGPPAPIAPPVETPSTPPAPTPVLPAPPVVGIPIIPPPSVPTVTLPTVTTPSVTLPVGAA
jgi:putative nucleotidyltransferase with HDIG domain